MAIGNHNDLTHIVRTSDQWKNTYDKYELIPTGVLCVELVSSDVTKIKIGDGHNIFSKLPYIGDLDLSKYYTKLETDTRIKEILTQEKVVRIKGIIGSKSDLPADARCGDIYFVRQLSSSDNKYIEYIYSPDNTWEPLCGIPVDIDLSEYAKTAYVDDKIEQVNERIDDIEQHGTHTHPNKEILDQITEPYTTADKETLASLHNYDDTEIREMISQSSHTHDNKDILDATSAAFTREDKSKLDQLNPYDDSILKEKIQALERLAHEHSNKRILDRTTASFTTEYERKMRWIRIYTGCTGMEEGIAGLVPAAQAGEEDYVLSGSGEWVPQTGGGGTYELPIATASTLGGIKVGNGLSIDPATGVLSATGGGGGDSIAEGGGINITTDPQTGVKTISINTGDNLEVDPNTGELNVTGVDYTAGKGIYIGAEYKNVEYIKNSGNYDQIILTDILPLSTDKLELDVKFGLDILSSYNQSLIGSRTSIGNMSRISIVMSSNNGKSLAFYNHYTWTSELTDVWIQPAYNIDDSTSNARQILSITGNLGTWGNQSVNTSSNYDPSFYDVSLPIAIFGWNSDGNLTPFTGKEMILYGVKHYDSNNTLLHNLVPVKRSSDNAGGLYDTITQKFYGNSGNGSFVTGPETTTDERIINAKIGDGLQFDSNNAIEVVTGNGLSVNQDNELEVNAGNGLQINQDGEVEIDPSIIPEVIEYNAGEAIDISPSGTDLPSGYADISYIESTGSQWTQLDYYANNNSRAVVDYVVPNTVSTTSDSAIFGSGAGSSRAFVFWDDQLTNNQKGGFVYGSNAWSSPTDANSGRNFNKNRGEHTVLDCSVNGCFIDNNLLHGVTPTGNFSSTVALGIFASATGDQRYSYGIAPFRIYSFKIYENDVLVVDLRPALRLSDNKPGFYDIINDDFYPSLTSTDFVYDSSSIDTHDDIFINVKYNKGLTVNSNNELEVVLSNGLEFDPNATETMVADEMYLFSSNVSCQVHTDNPLYSRPANRTHQKTTTEPALCCLWEVGDSGYLWTGPLIVGLTPTSVQYTTQDTQQTVNYQNTFTYLGKTWYTSGYPDFLNNADHEDKLGNLQYLGSYAAVSDQIQAAKDLIDLANVQFVSNAGIQAKLGNGLQFDANGAIEAVGGGETYDAGDGIEIAEVTHEDEFRVQNQEYFFTDHGLTCILTGNYGPRTFTKINDGDIVAAVIGTTGGWYMPLFVGLTENSVKYSNSYDSNILGPTGSFTYHDKTWYYTADYALTAGDGIDHAGHLQSMTDTIYDGSAGNIQAAKDLIDLAVLLSDVSTPTISAKIGAGLSFDANGAIQADAQPLSPATDSTLGGVIVGEGINVDEYGEISLSAGEGLDIDFDSPLPSEYTLVKGISSVGHNDSPYINTGYLIKPTSRIIVRGVLYKTTSGWVFPIGVRHSGYSNPVMFCTRHESNGDSIELWLPNDTLIASATDREKCYNDPVTIIISSDGLNIENETTGEVVTLTTSNTLPTATLPLYIFATNDNNTLSFPGPMDLYRLQIFEGTTKVLDYLPCKRNSDNKYGVYDIVANEYKASSNASLFEPVIGTPSGDDLIQQIKLLPATENTIGGVKPGDGILVDSDGTISVDPTIIPEITEYEAGAAISIEDVEHGGVIFDAWDSGTGWENVCYSNSTGDSVVSYVYEAHSPISNSYTLPTGATKIRAISYDQNDTMLWTSFSWIDSNNYHFASTSPEDGYYDDWFDIPTGAVKVNFGVRHSKLNTTTAMSLNDIKSVDITVQTVSEIEVDVWTGVTGWTNGDYYDSTSDQFTTSWPYAYHYNPSEYIPVPEGALKIRVIGISNENDSHFEGGGANIFDSNHHHIGWLPCCTVTDEWVDIPEGTVYVQPEVKWNNNNTRTISAADIKSVTLVWKLPALEINQAINVKYGDGLTVNQNNELEVNLGSGLQFDANGAIEVTGGSGGGDTIAEGDGITITTDSQTGVKTIGINVGDGLNIDPITNELFVDGQLPEGTIIKKLTYVGTGSTTNVIQFSKKPLGIISLNGCAGTNWISALPTNINEPYLLSEFGGVSGTTTNGVCNMSFDDTTNQLTLTHSNDYGIAFNAPNKTYTMYYLTKGHTGSGTSVNNEVSVVKTFSYVGTGTAINNIQFPETPDMILDINGPVGSVGNISVIPIELKHPTSTAQYIYLHTPSGSPAGNIGSGHGTYSFDDTTNVLTLTAIDYGASMNYSGLTYQVHYIVNEVIPSQTAYAEGEAISIETVGGLQLTDYSNDDFVDSITNITAGTIVKAADNSSFTLTATSDDCYTQGSSMQSNGSYPYNVKASTKYRFAWDSADPDKYGVVYVFENGQYGDMMHDVNQHNASYIEFTTTAQTSYIQVRFGVTYAGNSITYSNVRLYEVIEEEDQYDEISVKYNKGLSVNQNNELEVNIGTGLAFDPQTGAINVTGGGGGSGDTIAEGDGISITTDQQTGNKVIAVNPGAGLQVNQTTNELEVSSGVVTSITPTQNTPGSITVTEGDGTATPVSVISQMGGATSSTAGTAGYVPAPSSGDNDAYLRGDGTWDDSVLTDDDELTLVFVPDDYQPS